MGTLPGIATAYHTDGTIYYRASVTYNNKHISLGSYEDPVTGYNAYKQASLLLK